MNDDRNLSFIRERIPRSCYSLIDILFTNKQNYELAAADRWLVEATASHLGNNRFVWGELLIDLCHCYPLIEEDKLRV